MLCWTLFSPTRRVSWGMWSSRATLAAVTMKWWRSRSLWQRGGRTASLLPWTSGEQTLASPGTWLVEYHGIKPWGEEGLKKVGWYWRITSSKLRSDASQQRASQAKTPGGLHGWTRSSWTNSNRRKKPAEGGSKDRIQTGRREEYREIVRAAPDQFRKAKPLI